jgi:CRISP-associated protein Cas1
MIKKTLYFGNPSYLSLSNGQLVIKLPEVEKNANLSEVFKKQAVRTIPIEDIGVVILDHRQITVTQALMAALLDNTVALISCNDRHMPTGMFLPLQGNATQNERFRRQIEASAPLKKQLWQQTVKAKIENQAALLEKQTGQPARKLCRMAAEVKSGDADNQEAQAAVYYWRNIFTGMPQFVRGQDEAPPNNLLNYGYAILRAVVARALVGSGLLPVYGIFHHNKYNDYCLADDIMEPYRPYVDQLVIDIMKHCGDISQLATDIKRRLLQIPAIDVNIAGKKSPLMIAAAQTTASLAKCFNGESRKIIYPEFTC